MPDRRLATCRESLPEGYQFGDAGKPRLMLRRDAFVFPWPMPTPPRWDVIYGVGYLKADPTPAAGDA